MKASASVEAIDTVMKLGMNHPMGPLTLADFIGLDTCLAILEVLHEGLRRLEVSPVPAAAPVRRRGVVWEKDRARLLRLSRRRQRRRAGRVEDVIETAAFSAFEPSPEQREIAELAADVAEREIAPHIAQWDREHTFPVDLYAKLAAAGVLGMLVGERYGGGGVDYVSYALALEELARVDAGTAVTVSVHSMIATVIDRLGTDAQKDRYLPKLAQEAYLGRSR